MDEFSIEDTVQTSHMTKLLDTLAESGIQVLVTSRVMPSPSLTTSHVIETLSADESDIRSYVAHALHVDDSLVDILDSQLEADIGNAVVEQAKGMSVTSCSSREVAMLIIIIIITGFCSSFSISKQSKARSRDPAFERHYRL